MAIKSILCISLLTVTGSIFGAEADNGQGVGLDHNATIAGNAAAAAALNVVRLSSIATQGLPGGDPSAVPPFAGTIIPGLTRGDLPAASGDSHVPHETQHQKGIVAWLRRNNPLGSKQDPAPAASHPAAATPAPTPTKKVSVTQAAVAGANALAKTGDAVGSASKSLEHLSTGVKETGDKFSLQSKKWRMFFKRTPLALVLGAAGVYGAKRSVGFIAEGVEIISKSYNCGDSEEERAKALRLFKRGRFLIASGVVGLVCSVGTGGGAVYVYNFAPEHGNDPQQPPTSPHHPPASPSA